MPAQMSPISRAFLSHSWDDKAFARRVARRLSHRGVPVWVDDNEMQVGERLSERLQAEILQSSHFLVLLTEAANVSKWVAQEIEVAKSRGDAIKIIPLIAEDGIRTDLLNLSLGIVVADPWTFEERLDVVAGAILGRKSSADRDATLLKGDLGKIGKEAPELRRVIERLGKDGEITEPELEALINAEPLRHPAETALIALHESVDAKTRHLVALVAAAWFAKLGVGYEVLRRQIMVEPAGSVHLAGTFNPLGGYIMRQSDLEGVCKLFDLAAVPMDTAFERFVARNLDRFTQSQREWAVTFVTTPYRGPAGGTGPAAFELFSRMPESAALRSLWLAWVTDYKFGGKAGVPNTESVYTFYSYMNEAASERHRQFEDVVDRFRSRFKILARSNNPREVCGAVHQLEVAGHQSYVGRKALAREFAEAVHSSEWETFEWRETFEGPIMNLAHAVANDRPFEGGMSIRLARLVRAGEQE